MNRQQGEFLSKTCAIRTDFAIVAMSLSYYRNKNAMTGPLKLKEKPILQYQAGLPYWPDAYQEQSHLLARSGIYSISNRRKTYSRYSPILVIGEGSLDYMGQRLQVFDEDVFLQLIHYRRGQSLTRELDLHRSQLLGDLGLSLGGENYTRLNRSIERLESGRFRVSSRPILEKLLRLLMMTEQCQDLEPRFVQEIQGRYRKYIDGISQALNNGDDFSITLSFFHNTLINKSNGRLIITIDPLIVLLYDGVNTARTLIHERRNLCPAEKRLLTYLNCHQETIEELKIELLHQLLGSDTNLATNKSRFVGNLRQWLQSLERIHRIEPGWSIAGDKVLNIIPVPEPHAPQG